MSRVAVLKGGRSLERNVSLSSAARVEDALERLGHDVVPIDVGSDLVARLREARARRRLRRAARRGRRGRLGPGAARAARASRTRARGPARAPAAGTRCWPRTSCATPASRRRSTARSTSPPSATSAPPRRCRRSSGGSASRSWSSRPAAARRSGSSSPRADADVPGALVAAFAYDTRILLERFVDGRELAVSADRRRAAAGDRDPRRPARRYDFEARYEIGAVEFVCPAPLRGRDRRARGRAGGRDLDGARAQRLRPRRPDARRATAGCTSSRPTPSPASPTPRCSRRPPTRPASRSTRSSSASSRSPL